MTYTKNLSAEEAASKTLQKIFRHRDYTLRHAMEAGTKIERTTKEKLVLREEYKTMLINLPRRDLTISNIIRLFSYTTKKGTFDVREPIINTTAVCVLEPGEFTNTERVETTAGSILFNKLFIQGKCDHIIDGGYVNDVMNKKNFEKIVDKIADAFRNKTVSLDQMSLFLKDFEFYSLSLSTAFSPSFTKGVITPNPQVIAKRDELLAKLPEVPSLADIVRVEDELTAFAYELEKNDPGMTLYDSGSRGSFGNDYKMISIMAGAGINPATNKPSLIGKNYIEGVDKKDIPAMGNALVAAQYPKSVGTQVGGYITKQFYAVYQSVSVDADGTDCGTTRGLRKLLTNDNYSWYKYQNIQMPDGSTVTLTEETKDRFIGKEVIIRSPMYCLNDKLCSVCVGRTPYDFDMENIGLSAGSISNSLMNKRMKAFHETKVKFTKVDVSKLII